MDTEKTSAFSGALLWLGAAVSIAEIMTGALIAPLGAAKGLAAIVLGHAIGCALLYMAGLIGAKSKMAGIESSGIAFGRKGSYIFSALNILQLIGWTAVMIAAGADAAAGVTAGFFPRGGAALWSAALGALIVLWIVIGLKNLGKVNVFAVGALGALCLVLSAIVFSPGQEVFSRGAMTFGGAVELSVAMPVSWLPLIADYTRRAKRPVSGSLASALAYFAGSCWMYALGLFAALYTGTPDVAQILLRAGLGLAALLIVLISTVTTTFLDVYSAGVSFVTVKKVNEKAAAIFFCVVGTLLAIFVPITQYENFLYFIGSVFVPMIAILISDYFFFKKREITEGINIANAVLWVLGFVIYRVFLSFDTVLGSTIPVIALIMLLSVIIHGGMKLCSKQS